MHVTTSTIKMATCSNSNSKPIGYECGFIDKFPKEFFCKLCKYVAREANTTTCCGKTWCKECIVSIIQEEKPCPNCQDTAPSSVPHRKFQADILALRVRCSKGHPIDEEPESGYNQLTWKIYQCVFPVMKSHSETKHGCEWTGQLQHLDAHLDLTTGDCVYVDVDCPKGCEQKIQKRNVDTHLAKECPNRKLQEQQKIYEKRIEELQQEFDHRLEEKLQQQEEVHASYVNNLRLEAGVPPYKITLQFHKTQATSPSLNVHQDTYYFVKLDQKEHNKGIEIKVELDKSSIHHPQSFVTLAITVEILNQHRDQDHITKVLKCSNHSSSDGEAKYRFSLTDLEWNADKQTHYLKKDCLKLRIVHQETEWRRVPKIFPFLFPRSMISD
ncbi:uncharacterized protein LOC135337706 [Halichondria panicea]|uniref:uncharacterized protein LOC135337706 n=1 Tax=Halichondria panicea TaxID=6063 RepID=UPI00312B3984